jgi:hypothetical protein
VSIDNDGGDGRGDDKQGWPPDPRARPAGQSPPTASGVPAGQSARTVDDSGSAALPPFDVGFLVGLLVGEGHFGGDGRQPQVTLRMHTDHRAMFEWLVERFPGSRLYGPYDHGGRHYYQWMARGACLRDTLIPLLDRWLRPEHSGRAWERYVRMKAMYGLSTGASGGRTPPPDGEPADR